MKKIFEFIRRLVKGNKKTIVVSFDEDALYKNVQEAINRTIDETGYYYDEYTPNDKHRFNEEVQNGQRGK